MRHADSFVSPSAVSVPDVVSDPIDAGKPPRLLPLTEILPLDDWEAVAAVQQDKLVTDVRESIGDACCNRYDLFKRRESQVQVRWQVFTWPV